MYCYDPSHPIPRQTKHAWAQAGIDFCNKQTSYLLYLKDQGHQLTSTSYITRTDTWVDKTVQSTCSGSGTEQPSTSGKVASFSE